MSGQSDDGFQVSRTQSDVGQVQESSMGGTLDMATWAVDGTVLSVDSRTCVFDAKGKIVYICTNEDPEEDGYYLEEFYDKFVKGEEYAAVMCGSVFWGSELFKEVEELLRPARKNVNVHVNFDYIGQLLKSTYNEKLKGNKFVAERYKKLRFILVARENSQNLKMSLFGYKMGQLDKIDIPTFCCDGSGGPAATNLMGPRWSSEKTTQQLLLDHKAVMLEVSKDNLGVGGNQKAIVVRLNDDGELVIEDHDFKIGEYYKKKK